MTLVVVLIAVLPATAAASNPSVDQYVESVPTADGNSGGGGGGHGGAGGNGGGATGSDQRGGSSQGSLPSSVRQRIRDEGGSDAGQLEAIASSPSLGAPATSSASGGSSTGGGGSSTDNGSGSGSGGSGGSGSGASGSGQTRDATPPSTVDAVTTAAVDGGGDSMGVLFGGLILLTAIALGVVLSRRRS